MKMSMSMNISINVNMSMIVNPSADMMNDVIVGVGRNLFYKN